MIIEERMTRRSFLSYLTGGVLVAAFGSLIGSLFAYLWPDTRTVQGDGGEKVEVGFAPEIPEGKGKLFPYKNRSALVIHAPSGFVAFSALCSHEECVVSWDESKQRIICPCHGATFDLQGNVLSGPPPKPLSPLRVMVVDERIYLAEEA
jgi:cytochrome b6-f complex iron-sulfur subunit